MDLLPEKFTRLRRILTELDSVLVAFSAGVDSTLLLRVAHDVLAERVVAVTIASPLHPPFELQEAERLAAELGVTHLTISVNEFDIPGFAANGPDRCYLCKKELFRRCLDMAAQWGLAAVIDGSNADDLQDYRPGRRALSELAVRSPLLEAGLGKEEIRTLSRKLGLSTWNKQPFACLASRVPYGTPLTIAGLAQIGRCEEFLRQEGFDTYRVRMEGETARIETAVADLPRFLEPAFRQALVAVFKEAGFTAVSLDLEGYRTGTMNRGVAPIGTDWT